MKKSLGAKTLAQPAPVWVVGSYDAQGKPNMMTIAWGGICCSQPPCIAVSIRKVTYTYGNIVARKAFTVNIPSVELIKEADYVGIVSGKNVDKFAMTGLTPVRSDLVDAPCVKEFPLVIECKLLHIVEIGLHTQFVGEIMDVKAEEAVLGENGMADILKVSPFVFDTGQRAYFGMGQQIGKAFSIGKRD
jgi:flavin reductase (DIM6/NTAB) family NADH-FMN oxidoreductase RutF